MSTHTLTNGQPCNDVTCLHSKAGYDAAVASAKAASASYYDSGALLLDDADYDALIQRIARTEDLHPEWMQTASPTQVVGGSAGDVKHVVPMLSLDNVFSLEELRGWNGGLERRLDGSVLGYVCEPKLDGLALSARYVDGRLVQLVTRGDGTHGEDVTFAADAIVGLPKQLPLSWPLTIEFRGEVMLTDEQFAAANELRLAHGDKAFINPRNGAAGALRGAKDRDYVIPLTFFCYGAVHIPGGTVFHEGTPQAYTVDEMTHSWAMTELATKAGINTAYQAVETAAAAAGEQLLWLGASIDDVATYITTLGFLRDKLGFAIDGAVVKADQPSDRARAGFSSRAPRWGIAYKYPADSKMTKLVAVHWQVGRTGVITPRAEVEPVFVGGTTITFATLHNGEDIARKDIRIGDTVLVLRAGEVIPRIEAPVVAMRTGGEQVIVPPSSCPRCGGEIDKSQVRWRCLKGRACGAAESVAYAAGRDQWDIEGLGDKLVEQLVSSGIVTDVADIFTLTTSKLSGLDRMGATSAAKLIEQIEGAKAQPLARTLTALGIRGTGRSMSRRIAKHFGSMDAIQAATAEQFEAVEGIGKEKAPLIVEELTELLEVITKLRAAGVRMSEPGTEASGDAPAAAALPLRRADGKPMSVVVTGAMSGALAALNRNEMNELIEAAGGKSSGSVSKNTDLLVAGEAGSSKWNKAQSLGVTIETPEQFAQRVAAFL